MRERSAYHSQYAQHAGTAGNMKARLWVTLGLGGTHACLCVGQSAFWHSLEQYFIEKHRPHFLNFPSSATLAQKLHVLGVTPARFMPIDCCAASMSASHAADSNFIHSSGISHLPSAFQCSVRIRRRSMSPMGVPRRSASSNAFSKRVPTIGLYTFAHTRSGLYPSDLWELACTHT